MTDSTMTGGEAVVAQLAAEGVRAVFSIPGAHNVGLCDGLLDLPELRFLGGRHEQDLAFMANGFARASGKVAPLMVISGPGVTNSLTAMADAYADSVPMVLIAASPKQQVVGKAEFHELRDQTSLIRAVTKWHRRVTAVEQVPEAISQALAQAYAGRPGPTAVEVPDDVQAASGSPLIVPPKPYVPRGADDAAVADAARMLAGATRPLVLLGASAAECSDEIISLIENLNAVCMATALAPGVVPSDHPLCMGYCLERELARPMLQDADVILVVGCRLSEKDTRGWTLPLPAEKLIQIDACDQTIGCKYDVAVGLVGDPQAVLVQLLEQLARVDHAQRSSPAKNIADIKQSIVALAQDQPTWQFVEAMDKALPRDAFVTNDASLVNDWILTGIPRYLPRTINITHNLASLGFAYPAAIGTKVAYPERQAVAVAGDGGFLFTSNALTTAVQYRLNAVAVVFNDRCYAAIKRIQNERFGRSIGVDLHNPDYVLLAEAQGAVGVRTKQPQQLHDELVEAWKRDIPTVIEVVLDEETQILP
jgi:acetolactate synthase-1/2/3 large subunit